MRDDIPTLLRDAAADPSHTPDFDELAARGRRQHLAARAGTAAVAVVALVAGGLVLWPDGQPARGPVIGDQPTTPDQDEELVTLPAGWHEIQVGDVTFGVPGDWTVESFTEPADVCPNHAEQPTAFVLHAGPEPRSNRCLAVAQRVLAVQAAPLAAIPPAYLEPEQGRSWSDVTTPGGVAGQRLIRNDHGTVAAYRFPALDLWLQFAAPDPLGTWPHEILATLSSTSNGTPTGVATAFDADAEMRPDLIQATPDPATPGQVVELTFPRETMRGIAFVLEKRSGETWAWRYVLTSSPADSQRDPAWSPANDHQGWEDLGVGGPGPDRVVIPETAESGDYRICTANAGDEFCTPLRIDAQDTPETPTENGDTIEVGSLSTPRPVPNDPDPLARSGAAGRKVACDGPLHLGSWAPDFGGPSVGATDPQGALQAFLEQGFFGLPRDGYEQVAAEAGRVLFTYTVDSDPKVAVIVADSAVVDEQLSVEEGWGIEVFATCDPAEYAPNTDGELGQTVWTDGDGNRVPTSTITSFPGPDHCGWQSVTFLHLEDRQYLRDPQNLLTDETVRPYDGDARLPADAIDTGYRNDNHELWLTTDSSIAYIVTDTAVEAWPSTTRSVACA